MIDQNIRKIAILSNPLAGKAKSNALAKWLCNELNQLQIPFELFHRNWPTHFDGFTDIWILGGDGSVNYFINQFPDCKVPISVFKTGTGNDFAWKLYGNASNRKIFQIVLQSTPKFVDAGKCNEILFINSFGIGFDGEILKFIKAIRFLGGFIGYLIAVIIQIFRFKENRFQIQLSDQSFDEKLLLLFVNISSRCGGGFLITPEAKLDDGKFDFLFCKKLSILKRLIYLPILKSGNHKNLPFVTYLQNNICHIKADKVLPMQIDGELKYANEVTIKLLPKHFSFRY